MKKRSPGITQVSCCCWINPLEASSPPQRNLMCISPGAVPEGSVSIPTALTRVGAAGRGWHCRFFGGVSSSAVTLRRPWQGSCLPPEEPAGWTGRGSTALRPALPSPAGCRQEQPLLGSERRRRSEAIKANLASLAANLVACHSHRPICTMVNKSCSWISFGFYIIFVTIWNGGGNPSYE